MVSLSSSPKFSWPSSYQSECFTNVLISRDTLLQNLAVLGNKHRAYSAAYPIQIFTALPFWIKDPGHWIRVSEHPGTLESDWLPGFDRRRSGSGPSTDPPLSRDWKNVNKAISVCWNGQQPAASLGVYTGMGPQCLFIEQTRFLFWLLLFQSLDY